MPTERGNGHGDEYFLQRVRRVLRDWTPVLSYNTGTDGTLGTATPGSRPFKVDRPPVVRGSLLLTAPGAWTVVYDVPPLANQVEVVTDTGELIFNTPPALGNLAVSYRSGRFSDAEILDALYEGLAEMYPEIWQPQMDPPEGTRTSATMIVLQANTFEYLLPQFLWDPDAHIIRVEYFPPQGITRWYELADWDRVGLKAIKFGSMRTPGSILRFTYAAPYASLGDVEPKAMHVPEYYALARLMMQRETQRSAQDELVPQTMEGASAPGTAKNAADMWMAKFVDSKKQVARMIPTREVMISPTQAGAMWG